MSHLPKRSKTIPSHVDRLALNCSSGQIPTQALAFESKRYGLSHAMHAVVFVHDAQWLLHAVGTVIRLLSEQGLSVTYDKLLRLDSFN
jgi:hypothetical protein